MLTPISSALGFENYNLEVLEPSGGEESQVLHMVDCGAWLLVGMREKEGFPGASKKASRRGARYLDRNFTKDTGREAAIFMSRAFAVYMEEVMVRAGHPDQAEYHRNAAALQDGYLPLADDLKAEIERARVEFRRLDTREAPVMPANGWHMALLDAEGFDPDDPDLIETQLRHANMFFRLETSKAALRVALNERQFGKVEEDLLTPMPIGGYEKLSWDLVSMGDWSRLAEKWREALLL